MTMVLLPFALALAVGSYLFILSVYTTLPCLHLHHVQGAPSTATWIDLSNRIASTVTNVGAAVCRTTMASMRVAIATMVMDVTLVTWLTCPLPQSQSKQRVWDPGIALMTTVRLTWDPLITTATTDTSCCAWAPTMSHPIDKDRCVATRFSRAPEANSSTPVNRKTQPHPRLQRQWDPGIDRFFYFDLPTSHPNVVVVTMVRTNRLVPSSAHRDPTTVLPLTPSVSIFHYCHPVLSRPTVPNIDS